MIRLGRREPPTPGGVTIAVEFREGRTLYVHSTDRDAVRRRIIKAQKSAVDAKLPDGRIVAVAEALRVTRIRPATPEEAALDRFEDDCRNAPRWRHGQARRRNVERPSPRLTDPAAAGREPRAARTERGRRALEAFVRELRGRAS